MNKSHSMSFGGRPSTDRRSQTIQDFGLVRRKPSIASTNRLNGEFSQFMGATSSNDSAKNATWDEPDLLTKQAKRNQIAFNQAPKKRDAFAYYSCPDVRVAAILQNKKKTEGKMDMAKMMGLRRPVRRNSLQKNTPTASTLKAIPDDSSVATRQSRVSVEMHDSIIFEHLEEMLNDDDSDGTISEGDMHGMHGIAGEDIGDDSKNSSMQPRIENIVGRELIFTGQNSIESTAIISIDEAAEEEEEEEEGQ